MKESTMTEPNVYPKLVALLASTCGLEQEEITPESTFAELELDSLALVEFAMAVQAELGVPVSDDELSVDATVASAAVLVDAKLAQGLTV
jgi:acyl carrier protein